MIRITAAAPMWFYAFNPSATATLARPLGAIVTNNDNWVRRLRDLGRQKNLHDVRITGRYETMTSTQACRYRELKKLRSEQPKRRGAAQPPDKPRYTLAEASVRLSVSVERLLERAAEGRLRCYVDAAALNGRWRPQAPAGNAPESAWLAVPEGACRDIAWYGSANVAVLEYRPDGAPKAELELGEALWVDPARLVLKHPLPGI